ncbi:uncharacterized protein [Procambarus clarkii]|uniref:uncharacterized protein isoform X2 n=1 Tax=Procambarus clarkii TaxID=6728 RepID=UPI0037426A20
MKALLMLVMTAAAFAVSLEDETECSGDPDTTRWRIECNWCRCINGKGSCTRKGCPQVIMDRLVNTSECEGSPTWTKGCNTCSCVNGRAQCTTKECGQSPSVATRSGRQRVNAEKSVPNGSLPDDAMCTPDSRWKDECNWCFCGETGIAGCTLMGCPDNYEHPPGEPMCVDGSRWKMDNCNWCTCINGSAACTDKLCKKSVPNGSLPDDAMCTPDSRWKDECNWCFCGETGIAGCTLMGCPDNYEHPPGEPVCVDGSRWKMDNCNWCTCINGSAACTDKLCIERIPGRSLPDDAQCVPGSRWKDKCNWCNCGENGNAGCTEKGCPDNYEHPPGEPVCVDGSRWKMDNCNWCTCRNGSAACTEKLCIERIPGRSLPDDAQCVPGSRWKDKCNWCSCGENGDAGCTKKGCPDNYEHPPGVPVCVDGSRWKMDNCNWCTCRNGSAACTEKLCIKPEEQCTEGESWRDDCNVCHCSNGRAICTKKACVTPVKRSQPCLGETKNGCSIQKLPPHCKLPPFISDGALCLAYINKWTYDFESRKCQAIIYGGCGGTRNLYNTEEECKASCSLPPTNLPHRTGRNESSCDRSRCPWTRWAHYFAKNCLPRYERGSCCPTSFSCPSADAADPEKCSYRGQVYPKGSNVPVEDACTADCICTDSYVPGFPVEIHCAEIECPEFFMPPKPGCRPLYKPGECCSSESDCVDPDTPHLLESRSATCVWNNRTYLEGDRMYFEDYPCHQCICSPAFTDPNGPLCFKVNCGLDFRYTSKYTEGCVPIYFEDKCCPIDWLCPGDGRISLPSDVDPESGTGENLKVDIVNVCTLPRDSGRCLGNIPRIYYDAEASQCRPFFYGGCEGNNNNFLNFEACHQLCSKTPKPSESACIVGGETPRTPTPPLGVKVTGVLDRRFPSRMALQVEWSPPRCPHGSIIAYWVLYHETQHHEANNHIEWTRRKIHGDLRTQMIIDGLDPLQTYMVGVSAQNAQGHGDVSHHVIFSLVPPTQAVECYLGSLNIALGSALNTSECNLNCRCITPPEPTCVQYRSCTLAQEAALIQECAEPSCATGCDIIMDAATGCLVCSCKDETFVCPQHTCPSNCENVLDLQTGCLLCKCDCSYDFAGQPHCPVDCDVYEFVDELTGCKRCECKLNSTSSTSVTRQLCPVDFSGRAPCPMDCAIRRVVDETTGCEKCECDPEKTINPFRPHELPPRPPLDSNCPTYATGKAPCPMDCAIRRVVNEKTGCEICECDPNNPGHPFGPHSPPYIVNT